MKDSKPKILILGKLPPPYMGPAIATQIILNSSLNNWFELHHFDTRINTEIASMGKWQLKKFFKTVSLYFQYKKRLKQLKPDLVLVPISQTTMGFIKDMPFMLLAHKQNAKVLVQLRGSDFKNWLNNSAIWVKKMVRYTLKRADGVIVLGQNLKYLFSDYFDDNQIFVVPNGADYSFPEREQTKTLNVLYFANFLKNKGFKLVLEALAILKKRKDIPSFNLIAAGAWDDATYQQECLAVIEQNNLQNVQLHNKLFGKEKMQLFANADVFVFCPIAPEGHPWVIIEAMAAGLPVIATDKGAIKESVIDGKNGFIVPANNALFIADKLELLLKQDNLRKEMAEKSRQLYLEKFTEKKMVENLKDTFNEVLSKK